MDYVLFGVFFVVRLAEDCSRGTLGEMAIAFSAAQASNPHSWKRPSLLRPLICYCSYNNLCFLVYEKKGGA